MSTFIKAQKVVATSIGLLRRELVLPQLVYSDAANVLDPTLALNDTVTLTLPAYAPARTRALRSGASRVKDQINERKVDVTLTTDVYKDVPISDEQLTLDIANFGDQVLNPVLIGIAEQLEQTVLDVMEGATYATVLTHTVGTSDAYKTVLSARARLNNANVPLAGRALVVGTDFETELLSSPKFVDASQSGDSNALRDAKIGRVAGFDVFTAPGLNPASAYAFHKTAYAMLQRAPIVPTGAPWGAVQSYQGLSIRTVRVFDPNLVEDRFVTDAWVGAKAVPDTGHFTADPAAAKAAGKFVPVLDPAAPITTGSAWAQDTDRVVRSVKITVV